MFVPKGGGRRRTRWRRGSAPGSRCGKGNRPNGVGLGRPSLNQSTGLDWAGRVGLTRLETTGLVDGGIFPAQHMAGHDRGASTEQARPACGMGVVPGWVWGAASLYCVVQLWSRCCQSPWSLDPGSARGLTRLHLLLLLLHLHHHHHLLPLSITSHRSHCRPASLPVCPRCLVTNTNRPNTQRPTRQSHEPEATGRCRQFARSASSPLFSSPLQTASATADKTRIPSHPLPLDQVFESTLHFPLFGPWFHLCLRCSQSTVQPPPVIFIPAG